MRTMMTLQVGEIAQIRCHQRIDRPGTLSALKPENRVQEFIRLILRKPPPREDIPWTYGDYAQVGPYFYIRGTATGIVVVGEADWADTGQHSI